MRAYRFVDFLGTAVEQAGAAVADAAHVEFDHSGGLVAQEQDTPSERVGHELLRQIAREIDTSEVGRVEFAARALSPVSPDRRATESPGGDLGILFQVALPGFEWASATLVKTFYTPAMAGDLDGNAESFRERLQNRAEQTPSVYLLLVDQTDVRVVPAAVAQAIDDPITQERLTETLYSKSLSRFTQEFIEGFLGDPRLVDGFDYPDGSDGLDQVLRTWATKNDLQGAVLIRATLQPNREPASLRDFY